MSLFSVQLKVNGETYNKRGDDVEAVFLKACPGQVQTEAYLTVKHGKNVTERVVPLYEVRRILNNDDTRMVFINNLKTSLAL